MIWQKWNAVSRVILLISLLFVSGQFAFGQTPEYSVNIDLKDKELNHNDTTLFVFHLRGGGACENSKLKIDTDALMVFQKNVTISKREGEGKHEKIELDKRAIESCIIDDKVVSYEIESTAGATGSLGIDLRSEFSGNKFYDVQLEGEVKSLKESQSGEYNVRATFFCLNEGQWHSFYDEDKFQIDSSLVKWGYRSGVGLFIIALLKFIFTGKLLEYLIYALVWPIGWVWRKINSARSRYNSSR